MRNLAHIVTTEVDYSDAEREFMVAMDRYKRTNRRPFPTWREVLAVVFALGYRRVEGETTPPTFSRHPHGKSCNHGESSHGPS